MAVSSSKWHEVEREMLRLEQELELSEKRCNDQAELITKLSQAFSQERLVRRKLAEVLRECSGLTHSWMPLTEIAAEIERRANAALVAAAALDNEGEE